MSDDAYPPPETRPRAVVVRNIPRLADEAAVDEFFSFCGAIESKRMCPVPPTASGSDATLEAVVVFADDASRRTALLMNESTILDTPVTITAVPEGYNFGDTAAGTRDGATEGAANDGSQAQGFGSLFAGVGGLFSTVGSAVSAEYRRASSMLDNATESGVLKTAKDQAELARKKTVEMIQHVDETFHVQERAGAVAEVVTVQTRNAASVVATQSKTIASQVDSKLHISENTKMLQEKAMQNATVNSSVNTVRSGIDSLLTQTGLTAEQNRPQMPQADPRAAHEANAASLEPTAANSQ